MAQRDEELIDKYKKVTRSIIDNLYLIECPNEKDYSCLVGYNSHVIISESTAFLNAVRLDIGGEVIIDSVIGNFLYYGNEETTLSN